MNFLKILSHYLPLVKQFCLQVSYAFIPSAEFSGQLPNSLSSPSSIQWNKNVYDQSQFLVCCHRKRDQSPEPRGPGECLVLHVAPLEAGIFGESWLHTPTHACT